MILGIIVADSTVSAIDERLWLAAMSLALIGCFIMRNRKTGQSILIMVFFFCFGGWRYAWQDSDVSTVWQKGKKDYQAVIVEEPTEKSKLTEVSLRIADDERAPLVKAYIMKDSASQCLKVGDGIEAYSTIQEPYNLKKNNRFDYARYLHLHHFSGTTFIYCDNWRRAEVNLHNLSVLQRAELRFLVWRNLLLDKLKCAGISGQEYAVTAALTLGDKSNISKTTKDEYSQAGASHILALSGLHLGIIFGVLVLMIPRRRLGLLSPIIIILSIWAFVIFVGMSASVTRAAVMLTIYTLTGMFNSDKTSINTLSLAALIMLSLNAFDLFDVGFQLSFLAVLSISIVYRPLFNIFTLENRMLRWVWGLAALSVSAQLGTFPLVVYYFGRLPVYFLITNFIVIPCAMVILYSTIAMFVLSFITPVFLFIAQCVSWFTGLMTSGIEMVNSLPGSSISGLHPSILSVAMMYVAILDGILLIKYVKSIH